MFPETGGDGHKAEASQFKELAEVVIGNAASLREALHSTVDFNIDMVILDKVKEAVLFNNVIQEHV